MEQLTKDVKTSQEKNEVKQVVIYGETKSFIDSNGKEQKYLDCYFKVAGLKIKLDLSKGLDLNARNILKQSLTEQI